VPAPEFELPVGDVTKASMRTLVFDHDGYSGNDELCSSVKELGFLYGEDPSSFIPVELDLTATGDKASGKLTVAVRFEPAQVPGADLDTKAGVGSLATEDAPDRA